jgi:hypothetical protein
MANEIVCPVCNTSAKYEYVGGPAHCPICSAILEANKTIAKTGVVIGLYVFAVLTMIFGCVLGIVTISVWAIETGYLRTEIQQPTLFVSGCSIIWFSLVVGMILIALGKMVDNSDIQKYYTIAQAKRNSAGNESENKSNSQREEE